MVTLQDIGQYTFKAAFDHSIKKFPDCNSLGLVDGETLTFSAVAQRVDIVRKIIYSFGVKKSDKVAIWGGSQPNWPISYFSIVNSGAIAVPIMPDFTIDEVKAILTHSETAVLIVSKKMYAKAKEIDSSVLTHIIQLEDFLIMRDSGVDFENGQLYTELKLPEELQDVEILEDDIASIIYTSGTTGRSKGVVLTHKNIIFNAVQAQTIQRVNKRDKALSFLPIAHILEFNLGFVMEFMNGCCVYYLGKPPTVTALLPALAKIKPTIVLSVPVVMEKIYKNQIVPKFTKTEKMKKMYSKRFFQRILHYIAGIKLKKTFGGHIKYLGIGGARLDPDVEQFLKDAAFNYAIGYGLTETSPVVAGSTPGRTRVGTIGPTLKGIEVAILDPHPETGIGEVVVKGTSVMQGYYKDPELTASVFTTENDSCGAGWFKTGDLGDITKGFLALKGRSKNMILGSSGENIYPEDIEFVINQHPHVLESLVVEDDGTLLAYVQLDSDKIAKSFSKSMGELKEDFLHLQEEILSEIKFFTNQRLNKFSKVGNIKPVDSFEKTASSKIKRYMYSTTSKNK